MIPNVSQHPLHRADGSASYSTQLHSVLASANGPVEVQRRDELPDEAAIEVLVRPAHGVGGPRERWLESVIHALLRRVLLVHIHPRTLYQVTLQIVNEPASKRRRTFGDVALIPALVNAAFLALIDSALPLECAFNAALVAVGGNGESVMQPTEKQLAGCKSIHAFAYTQGGKMLLCESAGGIDGQGVEAVEAQARKACMQALAATGEDDAMQNGYLEEEPWLRHAVEERVRDANAWRDGG